MGSLIRSLPKAGQQQLKCRPKVPLAVMRWTAFSQLDPLPNHYCAFKTVKGQSQHSLPACDNASGRGDEENDRSLRQH